MNMPELSIIMPVYNSETFVGKAIESLLSQTYTDFELIIVNDASKDNSLEIVKSYKDPRIIIIENERNMGIVYSRNKGLEIARGKFIAQFDSDDIAVADKFKLQLDFLINNPDYGMIGSWAKMIDNKGKLLKKKWKLNAPPERIPAILLFRNYFVQSSIVMRREAIPEGGYKTGYDVVEDYIMWLETAEKFKTWNYPAYLVYYRIHPQSATNSDIERLRQRDINVYKFIFERYGLELDKASPELLLKIKNDERITTKAELEKIENLLLHILNFNTKRNYFNQKELSRVIIMRWLKSCYKTRKLFWFSANKLIFSKLLTLYIKSL
jgi:glycosyltransferase involved in cell wall biosynthesis